MPAKATARKRLLDDPEKFREVIAKLDRMRLDLREIHDLIRDAQKAEGRRHGR